MTLPGAFTHGGETYRRIKLPLRLRRLTARHPEELDHAAMSLDEIGQELGISRERVRQIEAVALKKLRRACARLGIAGLL